MARFEIVTFPVGVFQCNCSIIFDSHTKSIVVVDPGDDVRTIFDCIKSTPYTVKALWHTHAHLDHIGATKALYDLAKNWNQEKAEAPPQVFLYKEDIWLYENVGIQAQMLGLNTFAVTQPTDLLTKQSTIVIPELISFKTPGHTPGSACLKVEGECDFQAPKEFFQSKMSDGKALFTGDTLFRRSVGRTDLWGGNFEQLETSIRKHLYTLEDDYLVIPGHGAFTTIEEEKKKNPFVKA